MQKFTSAQWNNCLIALSQRGLLPLIVLLSAGYAAHAATVSINANPVSVTSGAPSTLTWSSTDASNCAASGAWSGIKAISGSRSVIALTGLNTYTLNCSGPSGSASNSVVIGAGTPAPAVHALNVTLTGLGAVTSNPSGIVCGTTCSANYPSGAAVSLSATPAAGNTFTGWGGACSGSGACVAAMTANRAVTATFSPPSSDLMFFDSFEYTVGRDDANAASIFVQQGRWNGAKTEQSNEPGANGHLYTVSSIPGYTGSFPGVNSQRVLAMEARPDLGNGHTDFYLQYGSGELPIGHIPPNHWFQFWVYSPDVEGQQSLYTNAKFIYPNRAEFYPATSNNGGYIYIMSLNKRSKAPLNLAPCGLDRDVGCTSAFFNTGWNRSQGLTNRIPFQEEDFGANLAGDTHLLPNQWTLVKIHIDISGTDPRATPGQGVFEMWIRRYGSTTWTKITEYIGGVTNVGGGPIDFTPTYTDGFRMLRIPTTFGSASQLPANWLASWTYLDDFAIARNEAALPQYP